MKDVIFAGCARETPPEVSESAESAGSIPKRERCHECGRFVSKRELAKVPKNGVPWCDNCVSD